MLYPQDTDFAENHELAAQQPERLRGLVDLWWRAAERCKVLPLDDRFAVRFANNARRVQGARYRFVMATWATCPTTWRPTRAAAAI